MLTIHNNLTSSYSLVDMVFSSGLTSPLSIASRSTIAHGCRHNVNGEIEMD